MQEDNMMSTRDTLTLDGRDIHGIFLPQSARAAWFSVQVQIRLQKSGFISVADTCVWYAKTAN